MPGRPPPPPPRPGAYRRWVLATSAGELAGFAVPTAAWGACATAGLGDAAALPVLVAAGAGEGAVLGFAQSRALRRDLPAVRPRAWVLATAAAAAVAWLAGMAPTASGELLDGLDTAELSALWAASVAVMLCSIGVAQALVLRRHVEGAATWVAANVLGWLAGLPLPFLALALAPEHPAALRAAIAVASGLLMGLTVALVTGAFLVRLLRRRRPWPPSARGTTSAAGAAAGHHRPRRAVVIRPRRGPRRGPGPGPRRARRP